MSEQVTKKKRSQPRQAYDKLWNTKPFKKRGVKFFLQENELLDAYSTVHQQAVARLVQKAHALLKSGEITVKDFNKQRNSKLATKIWKAEDEYLTNDLGMHLARLKRGACFQAMRLLRSYLKRNKDIPANLPRLRHTKATYLEEGVVSDPTPNEMTGQLTITVHGKAEGAEGKKPKPRKTKVDYFVPKGMRFNKPHLPAKTIGGNLVRHKGRLFFVGLATVPFEWSYVPVSVVGTDFNKGKDHWITISEEIEFDGKLVKCIKQPEAITALKDRLVKLNEEVRDKKLRSKQRRAVRRKVQKAHAKMAALCRPYIEKTLDAVESMKAVLCIDKLACGAKTGSFGQDKLVPGLIKRCEERRIPFVVVPTPHTTKVCNKCKTKVDRLKRGKHYDPNFIDCPDCGKQPSHDNAAKNIAEWGMKIWTEGQKAFDDWKAERYPSGPPSGSKKGHTDVGVVLSKGEEGQEPETALPTLCS